MAGHGGVLPAGEALRYAEYSPPQAKRSDTDIDRGLVSLLALPPSSRSKPREPAGYRSPEPLLVPASLLCTPNPPNGVTPVFIHHLCPIHHSFSAGAALCPALTSRRVQRISGPSGSFHSSRGARPDNRQLQITWDRRCRMDIPIA